MVDKCFDLANKEPEDVPDPLEAINYCLNLLQKCVDFSLENEDDGSLKTSCR